MTLLRRCIIGFLSIIALACVLIIALPDRLIKSLAINVTHLLTDRQLHIGSLDLERSLQPRLTLTDIAFENADWATQEYLFSVDRVTARLQLSELLKGQLVIQDAFSTGIETHIEIAENGSKNWQLSETPVTLPSLSRLTIESLHLIDTQASLVDRKAAKSQQLLLDKVLVSNDSIDAEPFITIDGDLNSLPVSAVMTLRTNIPGSLSVSDVLGLPYNLEITAGEIKVVANGLINNNADALSIDSNVSIDITSLSQLGEIINKPLPDIGPVNLDADISANPETIASSGIQIPNLTLTISDPELQLKAQGQFTDVPTSNTGSASVLLEIRNVDNVLSAFNVKRQIPGKLIVDSTFTGSDNTFDIKLQHGDFSSDFITATLGGTVTDITGTARADISVELDTPDLSIVTQLFGTAMPSEWGPVTASAALQGESGTYALNNIEASLDGNSKARAKGSIKSLHPFDEMHLDVDVSLSTLDEVSTFTRKPLPDIGPITGTGVVGWKDKKLFLNDAKTHHRSEYGIAVVTGNIGDLIHFDNVRLRADADLPDFSALDLFTGFELPKVDRVIASTNLVSANALDLSARQLTVTTTIEGVSVVATGAVESFIKPDIGVDLRLSSNVDSVAELNALSGKALPDLGPIQATARLKGLGSKFSLEDINAIVSDRNLSGTVTGHLDDLANFDQLDFDVTLKSENIALVATELGIDNLVSAPAEMATKIRINGKNLQLDNTDIDINGNLVSGNLSLLDVFDAKQQTKFKGAVTVRNVDTKTLLVKPVNTPNSSPEPNANDPLPHQDPANNRFLSNEPLPLDLIRYNDIDVDLQIQNLTTNLWDITDASLNMKIQDGILYIKPFSGTVNEGEVSLDFVVDTRKSPTTLDVDLSLNEFKLDRSMVFDDTELLESTGGTWADLTFTAEGGTIADILGSATGEGGFYIEDLIFNENVLSIFSSDLLNQLVDALNPFADRQMMGTQLLCSAILFELQDGVLETPFGFATEARDYSVVGDGQVNFHDETLELMFNTKPKTGLGISLNRLAGLVKLEGPLASPSLTLSELGLLQFGASIAAAVASGGVTLLAEGLYNRHAAMSDVCAQALGN